MRHDSLSLLIVTAAILSACGGGSSSSSTSTTIEPADTGIPTREDSGKDVWKIATPPPGIRYIDLDCDSFFDALMKVIQ